MCPRRGDECFARRARLPTGSNGDLGKPGFARRATGATTPVRSTTTQCFLAAPVAASAEPPEPRMALKKSEPVSTTITSDFLLKLSR